VVTPIELPNLAQALGASRGELVSLIGGGGKTTTLFALGQQLQGTTVLTTTTKMGAEQQGDYHALVDPTDEQLLAELAVHSRALVWKQADGRRAVGVTPQTCDRWFSLANNVVVEADGSRKRPFKAPATHEPVVPSQTTLLVACIGASAFGQPIDMACHRPELVAALAECDPCDLLTPERARLVLTHPQGSMKDKPASARFVILLHRVTAATQPVAEELAAQLDRHAPLVAVAERSND